MKTSRGEQSTGTDAEVCAYLNTASLSAPMDHDQSQIYLYVVDKIFLRWHKKEMPDDIRVDSLNDERMADLNRLKGWLYRQHTAARQEAEELRGDRRKRRSWLEEKGRIASIV